MKPARTLDRKIVDSTGPQNTSAETSKKDNTVQTRIQAWKARTSTLPATQEHQTDSPSKKRKLTPDMTETELRMGGDKKRSKKVKKVVSLGNHDRSEETEGQTEARTLSRTGSKYFSSNLNPTCYSKLGEMGPGQDKQGGALHHHHGGGVGKAEGVAPQVPDACADNLGSRSQLGGKSETKRISVIGWLARSRATTTNGSTAYNKPGLSGNTL